MVNGDQPPLVLLGYKLGTDAEIKGALEVIELLKLLSHKDVAFITV